MLQVFRIAQEVTSLATSLPINLSSSIFVRTVSVFCSILVLRDFFHNMRLFLAAVTRLLHKIVCDSVCLFCRRVWWPIGMVHTLKNPPRGGNITKEPMWMFDIHYIT